MNTNTPHNNPNNQGNQPPASGWVPPTQNQDPNKPHGGREFFDTLRSSGYFRSQSRWFGGVAGGLARRLNVDPVVVRALFIVVGIIFTGFALLAYAAAWSLLPEEVDGRIHAEEAVKGKFDSAFIVIILAVLFGFGSFGTVFIGLDFLPGPVIAIFWLAFLAAVGYVGYLIYSKRDQSQAAGPDRTTWSENSTAQNHFAGPTDNGTAASWSDSATTSSTTSVPPPVPNSSAPDASTPGFEPTPPHSSGPSSFATHQNESHVHGPHHSQQQYQYQGFQWNPPTPTQRVGGNGAGQFAILAGVLLLTVAGLLAADQYGALDTSVSVVALSIAIAVVLGGIAIVINGLRGATSGAAGTFGVFALIAAVFVAVPSIYGINVTKESFSVLSDRSIAPQTLSQLQEEVSFGIGDITVDLTQLDLSELAAADETPTMTISGGIGDITIVYPDSIKLASTTQMGVGDYTDPFQQFDGFSPDRMTLEKDSAGNVLEDPDITLDINLGVGSVELQRVSDSYNTSSAPSTTATNTELEVTL